MSEVWCWGPPARSASGTGRSSRSAGHPGRVYPSGCAGTIDGENVSAAGPAIRSHLDTRARMTPPPIDCFYLYPTQSEQEGPNANLDLKDPPIRRVVVQQARMFFVGLRRLRPDVQAGDPQRRPDHSQRQRRNRLTGAPGAAPGTTFATTTTVRGFILLRPFPGLCPRRAADRGDRRQPRGAAEALRRRDRSRRQHIQRPDRRGRRRPVLDDVPACSEVGQYGCVVAYSTFNDVPGPTAAFSRLDFGYSGPTPIPRPDPDSYEVICTNPAASRRRRRNPRARWSTSTTCSGRPTRRLRVRGAASPTSTEPNATAAGLGAHWLNLSKVGLAGDTRPDLGAAVASGSNYHVPEAQPRRGQPAADRAAARPTPTRPIRPASRRSCAR